MSDDERLDENKVREGNEREVPQANCSAQVGVTNNPYELFGMGFSLASKPSILSGCVDREIAGAIADARKRWFVPEEPYEPPKRRFRSYKK